MKLKSGFITHTSGDEQMLVATGEAKFSGLVRSNKTAAFIVDCLKENTTEAQIVEKMLAKYDAPEAVIAADVKKVIDQLRSINAIED